MALNHGNLFAAFGQIHCGTLTAGPCAYDDRIIVELLFGFCFGCFIGHLKFHLLPASDAKIIAAEIQGTEAEKPTSVGFSAGFTGA
jgi:hypothetical protein